MSDKPKSQNMNDKINKTQISRGKLFFEKCADDDDNEKYICILCGGSLSGKKPSNLNAHLERKHNDVYVTKINNKKGKNDIVWKIKRLKLLQYFVGLVTVDKQQFTIFSSESFQLIVADQLLELDLYNQGINITNPNLPDIKNHIRETAGKVRNSIKNQTKNKCISMSIDGVSKNNRSILGIYVQFIHEGSYKIRCIGMKPLNQRHTGRYFCEVTENCLKEYDIELKQVVSLTTDNAGNMRTLLKSLNEQSISSSNGEHEQPISEGGKLNLLVMNE